MNFEFVPIKEIESFSFQQKRKYFEDLKKQCRKIKFSSNNGFSNMVYPIYPFLRNFKYEIIGKENIPKDGKCLLLCNHSNSHDYFTAQELFKSLGSSVSVFAASDDLNSFTKTLFSKTNATLVDRNNQLSIYQGIFDFSSKLISGIPGVIFGEATWNLHPYKPMHQIKIGAAQFGAITEIPILPTIFEYVEKPEECKKESEIYSKCVIKIGKPFQVDRGEGLISQTMMLQKFLELSRIDLWKELNIKKNLFNDSDKILYLNHTYLKKFGAFGYTYDAIYEAKYLFNPNKNEYVENEYILNENGEFVPGVTLKKNKK